MDKALASQWGCLCSPGMWWLHSCSSWVNHHGHWLFSGCPWVLNLHTFVHLESLRSLETIVAELDPSCSANPTIWTFPLLILPSMTSHFSFRSSTCFMWCVTVLCTDTILSNPCWQSSINGFYIAVLEEKSVDVDKLNIVFLAVEIWLWAYF